jgi:hypothetical protein
MGDYLLGIVRELWPGLEWSAKREPYGLCFHLDGNMPHPILGSVGKMWFVVEIIDNELRLKLFGGDMVHSFRADVGDHGSVMVAFRKCNVLGFDRWRNGRLPS